MGVLLLLKGVRGLRYVWLGCHLVQREPWAGKDAQEATFTSPCWARGLGGFGSRERVNQPSGWWSFCPQSCLSKQQVLTAIRQLQQLLKVQETRFAEGLRNVRSRLAALQSSANRVGPDSPPGGSPRRHDLARAFRPFTCDT